MENGSADSAYYNFVDRLDMLGVGKDVPWLPVICPKDCWCWWMGYYAKGLDGRIDNPNGG